MTKLTQTLIKSTITFDETRSLFKWKLDWWLKVVRSLNRSWTHGSYFSLCRLIRRGICPGGNVREEISGYQMS